ncbi:MAG: hypothetical protein ABFC73_14165 [Clostridiaceae bacterium]
MMVLLPSNMKNSHKGALDWVGAKAFMAILRHWNEKPCLSADKRYRVSLADGNRPCQAKTEQPLFGAADRFHLVHSERD